MKQTLLFSNIIGNICEDDESCVFKDYMNEYLIKHNIKNKNLVFINAKGLGGEENYLNNIIRCFKNINIDFSKIYEIDEKTNLENIKNIDFDNSILFLMGGNPIVQYNEIQDFANQYKTEINALPDESIIVVEDDYVEVHGKVIRFEHIMREDKI